MKTIAMFAFMFAVHDCSYTPPPDEVVDADAGVTVEVDTYPEGPQAYEQGAVLPIDCLSSKAGAPRCPEELWDGWHEYWLIVASYDGCGPCDKLWDDLWSGRGGILQDLNEAGVRIDMLYGVSASEIAGFPTVFLVDLVDMRIVTESLGGVDLESRIAEIRTTQ